MEYGRPNVSFALRKLRFELAEHRKKGTAVKFIHGYGSGGKGGKIKRAVREELELLFEKKRFSCLLFGEDFSPFTEIGRYAFRMVPELVKDRDYARNNPGITVIIY